MEKARSSDAGTVRTQDLVAAWEKATGRRWDRLGERTKTQVKPYLSRAKGRPDIRFCIFAQGRTGSSLLRSLINGHPDLQCRGEVLGPDAVLFPVRYVERLARHTPRPAFGFKVKVYQLTHHQGISDPNGFMKALVRRGYRIIHLHRRNVLRQAISNSYALAAGRYHLQAGQSGGPEAIRVDPGKLRGVMERRQEHTVLETSALRGLESDTLGLVYEDHLLDPTAHQSTVDTVFEFLGLPPSVEVEARFERIVTGSLRDRISNFAELEQELAGTPFARHLDDPAYQ